MEEELIVDKNYQKGFNHGYTFAEYIPDVAKVLSNKSLPQNEYFKGFTSGKQEFEMEKTRTRLKGVSKNNTPDKDKRMKK